MNNEKTLPPTYKGYQTDELLKTWDQVKSTGAPKETPKAQLVALSQLLREYRLGMFANLPLRIKA